MKGLWVGGLGVLCYRSLQGREGGVWRGTSVRSRGLLLVSSLGGAGLLYLSSSIWMCLTSKIGPQTDIIFRQHPVQNLVNHSFICTIFAEREVIGKYWSSVNATLLLRKQTTKSTLSINLPGPSLLHTCRHIQSYMYTSLPAPLHPCSESARSTAATQTPLPPSSSPAFIQRVGPQDWILVTRQNWGDGGKL